MRGSDNEDISRKLFGAGGRARGERWRPSKHGGAEPPFLAGPQTPAFRSWSAECEVSQEEGEANAVKISSELGWEAEQPRDL